MSNIKHPTRTWPQILSRGIPLAVVGGAAMLITFATLIDVASMAGLPFPMAFPVVVDVGMVGLMITAADLKRRGLSGIWMAYSWFAVLSLVSVVANGTHALMAADMSRMTPWGAALLGAVPPATLLVMTHVLMKLIPDEKERAKLHARREKAAASMTLPAPPAQPTSQVSQLAPQPGVGRAEPLRLVSSEQVSMDDRELAARISEYVQTHGTRPTGALVGEWLGGKSGRTGQRRMSKLEEDGLLETTTEFERVVASSW